MKRGNIFILILSLVLVLAACTGGGSKTTSGGFVGGKIGVSTTLTIDSTSGGNKVLDSGNENFRILVNLQNQGEHTIGENYVLVTLNGVNFDAFSIANPTQTNILPLPGIRLEAGKKTTPAQIIIPYNANYKTKEDADRTITLTGDVCYAYETVSRVKNLCLRKQITSLGGTGACKVEETKLAENSAAPLQLTTFSERPAGESKVSIYIKADNAGKGALYNKDYLAQGKCIESTQDKNKVFVIVELTEFSNSAELITCSGLNGNAGFVDVIQNSLQLSCNIDTSKLTQETSFETPLRVTFNYVYKDSASTTINIKSSNPNI